MVSQALHSRSTSMAFKNLIFLIQNRLPAPISTTPVAGFSSSSSSSHAIPLKSAIAAQSYDSAQALFKSHGFDQTHLAKIMEKAPKTLTDLDVNETLKPKLDYLAKNGFPGSHLHDLVVSDPNVLGLCLSSRIKPSLEYLRSILGTEERLRQALSRVKLKSRLLCNDYLEGTLQPKVDLLVKEGVPLEAVTKSLLLSKDPLRSSIDQIASALDIAKRSLGMDPADYNFLVAVRKIAFGVDLWEKKVEAFKSFGFSQEQALSIFARCPEIISNSEETMRSKLEYFLGDAELKLDDIESYPLLIAHAIDRCRARHKVIKALVAKGVIKEDVKLASVFSISEDKFLKRYVTGNLQQVPGLLEMYRGDRVVKKIGISQETSI